MSTKLTKEEWFQLLFEYSNEHKKTPGKNIVCKGHKLGSWFHEQKSSLKDTNKDLIDKLYVNKFVKVNIEKLFKTRKKNADKKIINNVD